MEDTTIIHFKLHIWELLYGHVAIEYCHTRAPSWILSQAENLASPSLQDEATKWLYYAVGTAHPPTHPGTHPATASVGNQKLKLFCQTLGLVLRLRVEFVLPLSQEEQEEEEQAQEEVPPTKIYQKGVY